MSVDGHRTSVFTFQSAEHSCHVLRCLDEQRQNDVLCDVTVLVENRSYRAHCSVLASCSDFFRSRFTGFVSQNQVITLPDSVTVEGFDPLLQFAYTAKLSFTKDNILEIHRCAEFLGFHNLDQACFEFFIPKFQKDAGVPNEVQKAKSKRNSGEEREHGACSGAVTGDQVHQVPGGAMSQVEMSPQTPAEHSGGVVGIAGQCLDTSYVSQPSQNHHSSSPLPDTALPEGADLALGFTSPKSPVFPAGHDQHQFCLQNCGPELLPSLSTAPEQVCPFLKMVGSSVDLDQELGDEAMTDEAVLLGLTDGDGCPDGVISTSVETCPILDQPPQLQSPFPHPIAMPEASEQQAVASPMLTPTHDRRQPKSKSAGHLETGIMGSSSDTDSGLSLDTSAGHTPTASSNKTPSLETSSDNRSSVEREVAEHLARGFWSDLGSSLSSSDPLPPLDEVVVDGQSASENAASVSGSVSAAAVVASDFHWLKHLDLSSGAGECPFLRNLGGSEEAQTPVGDCSSLPQEEERSPGPGGEGGGGGGGGGGSGVGGLPPVDSEEEEEEEEEEEDDLMQSDTEGEREGRRERAEEIQLPFPVEQIPAMTRSAFQQMLRQQKLTPEQLEFVHDVRRRSKNRVAAQRSRKRKLDCIRKLECEIKKLRGQKEKLLHERSHLKLSMGQTLQGLSGLCQTVCGDGGPQPDQLQLLAQHLSSTNPNTNTSPSLNATIAIGTGTINTIGSGTFASSIAGSAPTNATIAGIIAGFASSISTNNNNSNNNTSTTAAASLAADCCAPSSVLLTPMASPSLAGQERDADGTAGIGTTGIGTAGRGSGTEGSGSGNSGLGLTKEPSGVEAATPCPQAEPAMPEQNGGEERG